MSNAQRIKLNSDAYQSPREGTVSGTLGYRNWFICEACPNEWDAVKPARDDGDWCPCCERPAQPYFSEALFDEDEATYDQE